MQEIYLIVFGEQGNHELRAQIQAVGTDYLIYGKDFAYFLSRSSISKTTSRIS
jgi:hypothetical protein